MKNKEAKELKVIIIRIVQIAKSKNGHFLFVCLFVCFPLIKMIHYLGFSLLYPTLLDLFLRPAFVYEYNKYDIPLRCHIYGITEKWRRLVG